MEKLIYIAIAALFVLAIATGLTQHSAEVDASYFYSGETTYEKIEVASGELTHTFFKDEGGRCAKWIKQFPCWSEADLQTKRTKLSKEQVNELIEVIEKSGFMQLKEEYGVVGEGQRFYSHIVDAKINEKEKRVVFKSSPAAGEPPEAFEKVKEKLVELAG